MTLTTTNIRRGMRKTFLCAALALMVLLCGCRQTSEPISGDESKESSFTMAGELLTAQASFVSGTRLFFHENGYLSYLNFDTGNTLVLCPDPLCLHDGDKKVDSECMNRFWLTEMKFGSLHGLIKNVPTGCMIGFCSFG